jgi:hypothetical protein
MSTEEPVQAEEMINTPEAQQETLFTEPSKDNVKITSGSTPESQTNVTIESELLNNALRFMVLRGKAWPNIHQAYIHLSMIFMNPAWYGENDLATKVNDNFKKAPFTAAQTKQALKRLSEVGILETKQVKGHTKYKVTRLGSAIISQDNILLQLLGFKQPEPPQPQPQPQPEASATLEANTPATVPEPVLNASEQSVDADPEEENTPQA